MSALEPDLPPTDEAWPSPLRESDGAVGRAVAGYARRVEQAQGQPADEAAAFVRAHAALHGTRDRLFARTVAAVALGAVALVVVAAVLVRPPAPVVQAPAAPPPQAIAVQSATVPAVEPVAGPAAQAEPPPPPRWIALGTRAVALAEGGNNLDGEAIVSLAGPGRATARRAGSETLMSLRVGEAWLQVDPRPAGRTFVVAAAPFRFVVVGTVFRVYRGSGFVTLEVQQGRVAVQRAGKTLAVITAGGSWRHGPNRTPTPPPVPEPPSAPDAGAADLAAYQAAAALLRAGGDLDQARLAFQSYQQRFPRGQLRVEAALSLAQILPRLGRHQEALAQIRALLAEPAAQPRWAEVQLLRGQILRDGLGDRAAAAEAFRAAAAIDPHGKYAAEATRQWKDLAP